MHVAFEEKFAELSESIKTSDFLVKLGVDDQVEVVIDLMQLCDVLILHLSSCGALTARAVSLWEADLVDHDVVDVNLKLC